MEAAGECARASSMVLWLGVNCNTQPMHASLWLQVCGAPGAGMGMHTACPSLAAWPSAQLQPQHFAPDSRLLVPHRHTHTHAHAHALTHAHTHTHMHTHTHAQEANDMATWVMEAAYLIRRSVYERIRWGGGTALRAGAHCGLGQQARRPPVSGAYCWAG